MLADRREGLVAAHHDLHFVPLVAEAVGEAAGQGELILDEQQERLHGCTSAPGGITGRTSVKVVPRDSSVASSTRPLCARATCSTMWRPRPVPGAAVTPLTKRLKRPP